MNINFESPIVISSLVCSFFIFLLIIVIGKSGKSAAEVRVKTYELVNNRLKEKKSFIDYEKIDKFLKKNGAKYHYAFMAEPLKFIVFSLIYGATCMFLGMLLHYVLETMGLSMEFLPRYVVGIIGLFVGFLMPFFLIRKENKNDNNLIVGDIKSLYSLLTTQIKSGIYVIDALNECSNRKVIKNTRLLREMQLLCNEIYMTNDINTSLNNFTGKFDNQYINSLSVIILQSLESGKACEALVDINEQVKEVERDLLILKREKKQFRNVMYQFAFLFCAILLMFVILLPRIFNIIGSM